MTTNLEQAAPVTATETDLATEIQRVLASSPEPLTVPKIRASLRNVGPEELTEALHRLAAANVVLQYPKYRSPQERFWDRPMPVHVASLIRATLEEGPLALSELRRKLPEYALPNAEAVLADQVRQGLLYRHPPTSKRSGDRFGVQPPDPRTPMREELGKLFTRLEGLGFARAQLRSAAIELLHEEEWAPTPPTGTQPPQGTSASSEPEEPAASTAFPGGLS
jgi:hypothetical protein